MGGGRGGDGRGENGENREVGKKTHLKRKIFARFEKGGGRQGAGVKGWEGLGERSITPPHCLTAPLINFNMIMCACYCVKTLLTSSLD